MKQCENGHFYDETRFESCPYCQEGGAVSAPASGADVGKTVAVSGADVGKTVALNAGAPGGTPMQGAGGQIPSDRGKTVGVIQKRIGFDPVVGYCICIEGPDRGTDYKLHSGRNFIGRNSSMDIALTKDDTVSRENHSLLVYDGRHNSFSIGPGMGRGITYCNGEQVEAVRPLEAYDVIEVGKSSLLFLPLCGERFRWGEE